ncbi:hypothetical protein HHI36_002591 [Cryptolaemus montrouzieri]|uniref:Uncharacterized protein n=1 Tax=Cryptolaemus montrouzieri TaxID=559131 RepID=A0ABD2PBN6_9CUCU
MPENSKIKNSLERYLMKCHGVALEMRRHIPRMKYSRALLEMVERVDEAISGRVDVTATLGELAWVVATYEPRGIKIQKEAVHGAKSEPPWNIRLEQKVNNARRTISIMHNYLNTIQPSKKLLKAVREVASEFSLKPRETILRKNITEICDNLQQKIKAIDNRMRRCHEKVMRYKNNYKYHKNQNEFFQVKRMLNGPIRNLRRCMSVGASSGHRRATMTLRLIGSKR